MCNQNNANGGSIFLIDSNYFTVMYADWNGDNRGYNSIQYNQSDLTVASSSEFSQSSFSDSIYTMGCTTISDNGRYIFSSYGSSPKLVIDTITSTVKTVCTVLSGEECDIRLDLGENYEAFMNSYNGVFPTYISDDGNDMLWSSSIGDEKTISRIHNDEFSIVHTKDFIPSDLLEQTDYINDNAILIKRDGGWYYTYTYSLKGENEVAGQYYWSESILIALDDNFQNIGYYKKEVSSSGMAKLYSVDGDDLYEMEFIPSYMHYDIVHVPATDDTPEYDEWQSTTIPASLKVNTYRVTTSDNGGDEDGDGDSDKTDNDSNDDIQAPNTGFKNN